MNTALFEVNVFNEHFATIGEKLTEKFKQSVYKSNFPVNKNTFAIYDTNRYEILEEIKNLNNKKPTGHDGISSKMVKFSAPVLADHLALFFNICFEKECFPNFLKIAKILPLYKNGDKTEPDNYRPISLLSCISKLFEKLIFKRISNFAAKNNLIDKHQFGFRSNHFCTHAILSITNFFRESIDKKFGYSCFIVLKKVFDTIDQKILLDKLYQHGFRGKIHKLMTNYLTGRKQYVYSNQSVSNMRECTKGVPQGSVLGPFLSLLYINDMPSASNVKLTLFADDTTVVDAQNFASKTKFQTELNKICNWCNNNKLLINQKKCKIMKFGRDNLNEKFSFGNNVLAEVSDSRFLGIQMDNRLKFESQINIVCSKLAKFNGLRFKGRNYFSKNVLVKFYNCYAKPLISYGLFAFGAKSKSLLEKIFVMQKRIFKTICFKRKFE